MADEFAINMTANDYLDVTALAAQCQQMNFSLM